MNPEKLTGLSTEELKNRERTNKSILLVFIGVYSFLIGVIIFTVIKNGLTPLIAIPIALFPILIINYKNLSAIKTEIKSREN